MKNIVQGSVITTFRCNARCHMCNIWKNPTNANEEINPKLMEKSYLLELSTNGYNTDKILEIAEKYPNILIRISVEGLPKLNDNLRGLPDGFDRALKTILELKKTKCKNIGFSIVICDKNADDLVALHELCAYLGVELGNSVMHNSWYFHKYDNENNERTKAVENERKFIASMLQSPRKGLKNKFKDYGRAYFNKSIMKRLAGEAPGYRPPCGAGEDFFFIDPWSNITPCNGSDEEWIMGNLMESSFEEIMYSEAANEAMKKVEHCKKDCCFIVTERHEMLRKPWKPLYWIGKNKLKLALNIPADFN